jgi:hypothetical protein
MQITITWWMVDLFLLALPILYFTLKNRHGDYDIDIDEIIVLVLCWALSLGLALGKLL